MDPKLLSPARRVAHLGTVTALVWLAGGCGSAERREVPMDPARPVHVETGSASWYGGQFAGRRTASGEVFDPHAMTAAHRTLPFGSVVLVTNLQNHRCALVRINDRGPFAQSRVLDCSDAAARALGFRRRGTARVSIEWPGDPIEAARTERGDYWLQLGAFESLQHARTFQAQAAAVAQPVALHRQEDFIRVHAGPYEKRRQAEKALARFQAAGFHGVVVMLDPGSLPESHHSR